MYELGSVHKVTTLPFRKAVPELEGGATSAGPHCTMTQKRQTHASSRSSANKNDVSISSQQISPIPHTLSPAVFTAFLLQLDLIT